MKNYRINPVAKDSDPVNVVDLHFDKCGLLRVDGLFEAKRIETAYNRYCKAMAQAAADVPALAGWKDLPAKKLVENEHGWENENGDQIFHADPQDCLAAEVQDEGRGVFYIYGNFDMKLLGINPADVQLVDMNPPADDDAEDSGKTITPAVAETASVTAADVLPEGTTDKNYRINPVDNTTNGGAVQRVISAEDYKKIDVTAKLLANFKQSDSLLKVELMHNDLLADNFSAFVEELKATKDYKTEYKPCLQRYLDQFNVVVAEPVKAAEPKAEPPAQKPVVDTEPFISCYDSDSAPVEEPKLAVVKPKIVQLPTRDELIEPLFHGGASDRAFAKRLEYFCGEHVKWCDEAKRWYLYSGGVWKKNSGENSAVSPFADELADVLEKHATNDAEHKLAASFQSAKKIGSAINLLKARHSVRITLDDLDNHPELLNVKNGVVDLTNGKLYPADPKLLLTKQAGAAYEPAAHSSLVEDFFTAIQPDETTMRGLLRWLAYNLTSETREHKFAIWTGERGANGKSTLSGVMLKLAGSYGTGLGTRALLKNPRPADANAATTSINALEGVRFALAEEMPIDAEIDSSLIKNLSGGDDINIRLNYGEFRTVPNFAKINISGNYLPKIENVNDGGIRRRLLNFAFNVRFGVDRPADPLLKEKLCSPENLNALLAILVREAALWYRDGLIISDAMKAETQRQLDASNFVADFIDDNYVRVPTASVKAKEFIEELKREYPRECSRFKRADLVQLIAAQDGVSYGKDNHNANVFKGIGKAARDDFDGEPIDPKDTPFD